MKNISINWTEESSSVDINIILANEMGQHQTNGEVELSEQNCPSFDSGARHGTNVIGETWK